MRISFHIRALAAVVLIFAGMAWSSPEACARKKKKVQEVEQPAVQQQRKVSLSINVAELRDSINREGDRLFEETMAELADSDRVEYTRILKRFQELTRLNSAFNASSGSYLGDLVIDIAKEHLGKPYVWGKEGPDSFDCSGFVMFCYRQVGIRLPRTSREQFREGEAIEIPDLKKGDLVFWSGRRGSVGATIGHVGMICDVDYERGFFYFIHANSGNHGVSISRSDEKYFLLHYKGARRIIPIENKK